MLPLLTSGIGSKGKALDPEKAADSLKADFEQAIELTRELKQKTNKFKKFTSHIFLS